MVSTGLNHSCGIATDGVAYCWGTNPHGQLGTVHGDPPSLSLAATTRSP
ncbi:RCC1 domain-containing protein [Oerskovia sp. M15]